MKEDTYKKTVEENTQEKVILEFREESVSNIIYEESSRFRNSVSRQAYQKAFEITKVIVSANCNYQNKLNKGESGTALRNQEQFFNIIEFSGNRGTGKTSTMLSYMEFLKDYYRNLHSDKPEERLSGLCFKNIDNEYPMELMFTGLEYIDASLLGERKDDVLRNVLPKMLKKWNDEERRSHAYSGIVREEDYAYKKRQIHMLFNNVYKSLRDLNSSKDILESDNDMFMETIENLSLTWNLRQSFQQLVEAYLDIMEYPGSKERIGSHNHFLVISIDDLDMNIEHGFELLEEIRKYLMVPNVIVLLSANYQQLEKLCIVHYTNMFKEIKGDSGVKEYIARLAREYLEKILPTHCQVIMEPVNQWEYYDRENIGIKYTRINNCVLNIKPATLKKITQEQLTDYFGLNFYVDGKCLRYFIPSTIRELALWVRQLYSLNDLREYTGDEEKLEKNAAMCKNNLKWLWREKIYPLYEKYLDINLSEFELLSPEDQILHMKKNLSESNKKGISLLKLLNEKLNQTRDGQTDAILWTIYLTVKLTELFLDWRSDRDKVKRLGALNNIKQYFGNSIWGQWEQRMICRGISTVTQSEVYNISIIKFKTLNKCLDYPLNGKFSQRSKEQFVKRNQEGLKNYQLLLMFFDFSYDFNFSTMKFSEDQGNHKLELGEDTYKGNFTLSNIMRPWENKEKILTNFLENFLKTLGTTKDEELGKKIIDLIDIRQRKNNCINMPLDNIEYLIHIGNELEENSRHSAVEMEPGLILKKLKEYFSIIRNSLKEYDTIYKTSYEIEFDNTQIGIELSGDKADSNSMSDSSLLHMLSECICRIAVPEPIKIE